MSVIVPSEQGRDATSNVLAATIASILEGVTGIAASERKDVYLSLGHIFQRMRSRHFLQTLYDEWDSFRKKGRIKDDYVETEQHQDCLQEMLDFLDKDSPDGIRFNVLKKLFLIAATETVSDKTSVLPQQYMRVSRGLSSGQVCVLQAAFSMIKSGKVDLKCKAWDKWAKDIAKCSGLGHVELVEIHERKLIESHLLTERHHSDPRYIHLDINNRLTSLAFGLCEFLAKYDESEEAEGTCPPNATNVS